MILIRPQLYTVPVLAPFHVQDLTSPNRARTPTHDSGLSIGLIRSYVYLHGLCRGVFIYPGHRICALLTSFNPQVSSVWTYQTHLLAGCHPFAWTFVTHATRNTLFAVLGIPAHSRLTLERAKGRRDSRCELLNSRRPYLIDDREAPV